MSDEIITHAFNLIKRARHYGIRLTIDNNDLIVKFSKEKTIDRVFLEELKTNKDFLIEFLKDKDDQQKKLSYDFAHSEDSYYEITSSQEWWVNPEIDSEFKMGKFQLLSYKIEGAFDINIFEKSIAYLINRHESLRATFHKIDGKYKMKVMDESLPIFKVNFVQYENILSDKGVTLENFYQFADHSFDVENGPLFLVRLIQKSANEFFLSCKLHHVIYDGWSMDILLRDLLLAYGAFAQKSKPDQKKLKYQYKDYNAFANEYRRRNYESHKKYWYSLYDSLPGNLLIQNKLKSDQSKSKSSSHCSVQNFSFSNEIMKSVNIVAAKYYTTSFVIFQAVLKSYLFTISGQNDIVIGTLNFGRDQFPGDIEDQIGNYSRMYLLRTILNDSDSFEEVVRKVKKSNDDAQRYNGFTLTEMLESMLTPDQTLFNFWKISIQYGDQIGYINNSSEASEQTKQLFDVYEIPGGIPITINMDMEIEIFNLKDMLNIRVIYRLAVFNENEIQKFVSAYLAHLKNILS